MLLKWKSLEINIMKNSINFAKEEAKKILLDLKLTLGCMLIVTYTIVSVFTSNACSTQGDKNQKKEKFNYGKKSINHIYKS